MSLRLLCLFLLMGVAGETHARGFWRALKNWVDSADIKGCDTTYLHLPKEGFIGYTNVYLTGAIGFLNYDQAYTQNGTVNVSGNLDTQVSTLFSANIAYRGWGLSYSKDFSNLGDNEWSFCSYGQRYGLELRLHNSYSFNGLLDIDGASNRENLEVKADACHQRTQLGNLYYVFNCKRFSLPAAMSHTIIQKKSSGSWLAILNYRHSRTIFNDEELSFLIGSNLLQEGTTGNAMFKKLSQTQVSIGGGYAHNFVFDKGHYLLHLSAMPMLSVWHRNRRYYDVTIQDSNSQVLQEASIGVAMSQKIAFNGTLHASFVYNFSRYVTGVMAFANVDTFPEKDKFSLYTFDWSSRFFFGVRF